MRDTGRSQPAVDGQGLPVMRSQLKARSRLKAAADVIDVTQAANWLHGEKTDAFADGRCQGVAKREATQGHQAKGAGIYDLPRIGFFLKRSGKQYHNALRVLGVILVRCSLLIAWLLGTAAAIGQTRPNDFNAPMQFQKIESRCAGSANFCGGYLLARGRIVQETPKTFEAAIRGNGYATVMFDSPGGDVTAALALGSLIRRHGYDTVVGADYTEGETTTLVTAARCYSACAYAFMGGVGRTVEPGGELGFHQMRAASGRMNESDLQVLLTLLSQYMDLMGIDRRILDIASMVPPNQIESMSSERAKQLLLDNSDPPKHPWELKAEPDGALYIFATQQLPSRDAHVTVGITVRGAFLVVSVLYRINQTFRTRDEMDSYFSGQPDMGLVIDGVAYRQSSSRPWSKASSPWQYRALAAFDQRAIAALTRATAFEVVFKQLNMKVLSDVDPSATLSVQGLSSGVAALVRSDETRR